MPEGARVLALSRNSQNLEVLARILRKAGYDIVGLTAIEPFVESLESSGGTFTLALVDSSGYGPAVLSACEKLKERNIPFFLLVPRLSPALRREGLARGARMVASKPVRVGDLLDAVSGIATAGRAP